MQPPATAIPAATLHSYEQAIYTADLPTGTVTLHIGQPNPDLSSHLAGRAAILITAWNPEGTTLPESENHRLAQLLLHDVQAIGLPFFPADGRDTDSNFHEPGLMVLGLSRAASITLGRTYRQNALVWIPPDGTPELLLLR